jgi:hypothetical protein
MSRLSAVILLVLVVASAALAAPPDEIRVSSLGGRGTTFSDEWPGTFADNRFDGAVSAAGDVNGDGFADVLILHQEFVDFQDDRPPNTRQTIYLVRGGSDLPQGLTPSEMGGRSTVLRWQATTYAGVRGTAPAGDVDGDGLDDFFVLRPGAGSVPGGGGPIPGIVYLIHGTESLPAEIVLDAPPPGIRITLFTSTKASDTQLALSVARGDLNGDGQLDTAFGAGFSDVPDVDTEYSPGRLYVLLGDAPMTGTVDVEDAGSARPGFILDGPADGVGMGGRSSFPAM